MALRHAAKGYVLRVSAAHHLSSWIGKPEVAGAAEGIAKALDPAAWQGLSVAISTKSEQLHDWAYLELADLDADELGRPTQGLWTRGLLIRRQLAGGELACFTI